MPCSARTPSPVSLLRISGAVRPNWSSMSAALAVNSSIVNTLLGWNGSAIIGADLVQLNCDRAIVQRAVSRFQLGIVVAAAVYLKIALHLAVGAPDRTEAGGLCGHDVNSATEVHAQFLNARADELEYLVFYQTS